MTTFTSEVDSFQLLRNSLRSDLVSLHGFSNPDAGWLLNHFDPSNPEYLANVDAWQAMLCTGESPVRIPLVTSTYDSEHHILTGSPDSVGAVHQVAKLLYKWHGVPRRETNWSEVKMRLQRPLPITLKDTEIDAVRYQLRKLEAPNLYWAIGRFGPGSTAEGYDAYEKWSRLGAIPDVPPTLYRCSIRDSKAFPRNYGGGVTKIAEVPKSIKCNRIVSSEPAMFMFSQLAVADELVHQLHKHYRNHVSLDNQTRHNEALMWPGACSIDLSDASDHVQCDLVQAVLPQLWPVLAKVRSSYSQFPDGDIVQLGTFAPMGSGVCFPVLTMVCLGICLAVIERHRAANYGARLWCKVYGDDIIVPRWIYDDVVDWLSRAGLVVNVRKSCCTGDYVESCGKELYKGVDVTPAYLRDPLSAVAASKIEGVVQALQGRFFYETAKTTLEAAQAARSIRWNRKLQRQEVLVRVPTARQKISSLDGWDGLNRWFAIHSKGNTWDESGPEGVARESWVRPGWRYKAVQDYPAISTWLVTRRKP